MDLADIQAAVAAAEASYQALGNKPKDDKLLMQIVEELRLLRILLAPALTEE